ncbi:hypothetical protein Agub_g15205 [Astrephomene gubernaculifera]|uniref:Uncharacterized protein n=1 Tax=Astrephomene gubernaculifera TaxID=47775 RepID=A0AAD3E4C8_9CHLO|nr:hypothetical protein Agub_g15205 [Astrephomene gubernaculifera]
MSGGGQCWVRRHLFWDCCVARNLREAMGAGMGVAEGPHSVAFSRSQLWLFLPPRGIQPVVWDVVALAALAALERGRQYLYRDWDSDTPVSPGRLRHISAEVVVDFWARISSFASLGIIPRGWASVPSDHPFLARQGGRVVFYGPPYGPPLWAATIPVLPLVLHDCDPGWSTSGLGA